MKVCLSNYTCSLFYPTFTQSPLCNCSELGSEKTRNSDPIQVGNRTYYNIIAERLGYGEDARRIILITPNLDSVNESKERPEALAPGADECQRFSGNTIKQVCMIVASGRSFRLSRSGRTGRCRACIRWSIWTRSTSKSSRTEPL